MRRWAGLLMVAAVVLSACTLGPSRRPELATSGQPRAGTTQPADATPSTTSPQPADPGGPGRSAPPINWQPCPDTVPDTAADGTRFAIDCATVAVPVSYAQPQRGELLLHVSRARGTDGTKKPADEPVLLTLPAEPGTAQVPRIAEVAAALPSKVRSHFTVVAVDLRGTGASAGFSCVTDSTARAILGMAADPTTAAGGSQLNSIARQLTFDCGDTVGAALTTINSTNATDDLDTLRAALGVDSWTILARGYGATIAATYADRYASRVHAMVLDSPTDALAGPAANAKAAAVAAQTLLTDFAAACRGWAKPCPLGDDPAGAISDLVDDLATSGDTAGDWVMTSGSVLLALLFGLPDRGSWPDLAAAIAALEDGDAQPLATVLTTALGGDDLQSRLTGSIVYRCNDVTARLQGTGLADAVAAARDAAPLFGPFTVALAGLCGSWPAPDRALGRVTAGGARPILVLGAVDDPVYPYSGAQSIAAQLSSATLVSWQSGATRVYPASACATDVVDAYLLRNALPGRGVLCPP